MLQHHHQLPILLDAGSIALGIPFRSLLTIVRPDYSHRLSRTADNRTRTIRSADRQHGPQRSLAITAKIACPRCGYANSALASPRRVIRRNTLHAVTCGNCGKSRNIDLSEARDINGDRLLVDKNVFGFRSPTHGAGKCAVFRCPRCQRVQQALRQTRSRFTA